MNFSGKKLGHHAFKGEDREIKDDPEDHTKQVILLLHCAACTQFLLKLL